MEMSIQTKQLGKFTQINQTTLIESIDKAIANLGHTGTSKSYVSGKRYTKFGKEFATKYSKSNTQDIVRTRYRVKLDSCPINFGTDKLFPLVEVRDSTFPGQAFSASIGLYRQVCSNGLMAQIVAVPELRIRHTSNNVELFQSFQTWLQSALSTLIAQATTELTRLVELKIVNPITTIHAIAASVGLGKRTVAKLESALKYHSFRAEDDISTAWGLYNVINEVDRREARTNSTAYLKRDTEVLDALFAAVAV